MKPFLNNTQMTPKCSDQLASLRGLSFYCLIPCFLFTVTASRAKKKKKKTSTRVYSREFANDCTELLVSVFSQRNIQPAAPEYTKGFGAHQHAHEKQNNNAHVQ